MKKHVLSLLCLSLLWSQHAAAGPSVELKVRGMIKPAACTLTFTDGGTVDLGIIPKNLLNKDRRTLLSDEKVNFSINCDAPARVSLDLKDNRAGTAASTASLKPLPFLFGLGMANSSNVGAYTLSFDEESVADQRTVRMVSADNNTNWGRSNTFLMPNQRHSWTANETGYLPTAFTTLTGVITLAPAIAPTNYLPGLDEMALDGLASFELNYL